MISEMYLPEASLCSANALSNLESSALCCSVSWQDHYCFDGDPQLSSKIYHYIYKDFQSNSDYRREFFAFSQNPS
jgi:hypothetical protein